MSYTPPTSSAVNASFVGATSYTPPSSGAANASWAPTTPVASGFSLTNFGIGSIPLKVVGISSTQFGVSAGWSHFDHASTAPFAAFGEAAAKWTAHAEGFLATSFGSASGPSLPATGWVATTFGLPQQRLSQIGLGKVTKFGRPVSPFNQSMSAMGWRPTVFSTGHFASSLLTLSPGKVARPTGWLAIQFGAPDAAWSQSVQAVNWHVGALGQPAAKYTYRATGSAFGVVGSPTSGRAMPETGSAVTRMGAPASLQAVHAAGFSSLRFGSPRTGTHCAHRAAGLNLGRRFGVPHKAIPFIHRAYGINNGRRFGQPRSCLE